MNKKIKGYELIKLIAEKQIKEKQEFLFTNADGVEEKIFWNGENLQYIESERDYVRCIVGDIEFAVGDFKILEDEEEIDIQDIEENKTGIKFEKTELFTSEGLNFYFDTITMLINEERETQNKLIKAVKQLDKKINKED